MTPYLTPKLEIDDMILDYFTSQFIESSPYFLRQSYNKLFIKSLLSLVDTAARGFKKDYVGLKERINNIDPNKKLNQQLYAVHASLMNSLKMNNAPEVSKLLESLSQILNRQSYASLFDIRTITSETWEQNVLESLKEQNLDKQGKMSTINLVDENQIMKYSPIINESLKSLKIASPLFYDEFESYVAEIKLFSSDRLVGLTDPRVFGTVYISISNTDLPLDVYFCEHIIHETSHLHLNTLFAQDPLILNDPQERYSAPIRPDSRPMYGIFHATFVLSRMVRIFHQLFELLGKSSYQECLNLFQRQFFNGYTTIINHAKLTKCGEKIVSSYSDIAMQRQ